MKKTRLSAFVLSMIFALGVPFSVGACAKKDPEPTELPVYEQDARNEFLIGSWVSYYDTHKDSCTSMAEQTKAMADAGINYMVVGHWIIDRGESVKRNVSTLDWWKHVDDVMVQNGMYYNFSSGDHDESGNKVEGSLSEISEEGVRNAEKIVPHLKNCIGYMMRDEPNYTEMTEVGSYAPKYASIRQNTKAFCNMNPGTVIDFYKGDKGITGPGDYQHYLEHWLECAGAENLEYLSHDFYPFKANSVLMDIFNDMEAMRRVGLKNNLKTHAFLQSNGFEDKRMPNLDELRWNMNMYLAYGFKALTYFNWVMWSEANGGIINPKGEITDNALYEGLAGMNWEVRNMQDIIMDLDCLHAYHTKRDDAFTIVEMLPSDWVLSAPASADIVVSQMQTKTGKEPYFVITNRSFAESQNVTLGIDPDSGITGLMRYNPKTGEYEDVAITDNSFTVSLGRSEAAWIKVKGENVRIPE